MIKMAIEENSNNPDLESALHFPVTKLTIDATNYQLLVNAIAGLDTFKDLADLNAAGSIKVFARVYSSGSDDGVRQLLYLKNILFKLK